MKKLSILAISLMTMAAVPALAQTDAKQTATAQAEQKTAIKPEQLPEGVQKSLKADSFKDWTVSSASSVGNNYEVTLTKDKESKAVRFDKEGTILK